MAPRGLATLRFGSGLCSGCGRCRFSPQTLAFNGLGMALAAIAIALAGFSTYVKGLAALRNGRLNINALMTVAVTGAFDRPMA